jgi:hypothetical protein
MEVNGQLHDTAALPSKERAPVTHWIGGWVGPRAGLDEVVKREILSPCRDSNPYHPARSPALYRLSHPIPYEGLLIRAYSLFKRRRLSTGNKLTLHKALIKSVMTYLPLLEVRGRHLLKFQLLQNKVLHTTGNFTGRTPTH